MPLCADRHPHWAETGSLPHGLLSPKNETECRAVPANFPFSVQASSLPPLLFWDSAFDSCPASSPPQTTVLSDGFRGRSASSLPPRCHWLGPNHQPLSFPPVPADPVQPACLCLMSLSQGLHPHFLQPLLENHQWLPAYSPLHVKLLSQVFKPHGQPGPSSQPSLSWQLAQVRLAQGSVCSLTM